MAEMRQTTHTMRFALGVSALGVVVSIGTSGCIQEGECGICNEHSLELQMISGNNYAGELVHLVSPTCEGDECPEPFTSARRFVETIGLCEETDAALVAG